MHNAELISMGLLTSSMFILGVALSWSLFIFDWYSNASITEFNEDFCTYSIRTQTTAVTANFSVCLLSIVCVF